MRIAILVASEEKSDVLKQYPNRGEKIAALFGPIRSDWSFEARDVVEHDWPGVDEYDAFVVTGSPHSVRDDEAWIERLHGFLRALDRDRAPFLGICFGHQCWARALGGEVAANPNGTIIGVQEVEFEREVWMDPWPLDLNGRLALYSAHSEQVRRTPPGTRAIARAPGCPIAAMRTGDHALTVEYHPEIYRDFSVAQIRSMASSLDEDTVRHALSDAERETHGPLFGKWAARFLERAAEARRAKAAA